MTLLIETLESLWAGRDDFFAGGNMFFYFSALQDKKNDFRGPDVFVVLDTEHRMRASWVVWEENGQVPNFVLEILSPRTEAQDRGEKWRIYEKLGIPEYFLYDPYTGVLEGHRLGPRRTYQRIEATPEGRVPSQELGLLLGVWEGTHLGYRARWPRWYTAQGELVPTPQEKVQEYERLYGPLRK
jgi:Uma2 family endonuclease